MFFFQVLCNGDASLKNLLVALCVIEKKKGAMVLRIIFLLLLVLRVGGFGFDVALKSLGIRGSLG